MLVYKPRHLLIIFSFLFPFTGFSQTCKCPATSTCNPCSGGITSITLEYKGSATNPVKVTDNSVTIYSQTLNPGDQFTINGSTSNGKFNGTSINISINGLLNVTIDVRCSLDFDPDAMHGNFKIISAVSKNGGQLCCTLNSDTTPPVITGCPANIEVSTKLTECFSVVSWVEPNATDCSLKSLTSNFSSGTQFPVGVTKVIYTAKDARNNASTCSFNVIVHDVPPVVSNCPADIMLAAGTNCTARGAWSAPVFTDNCNVTVTSSHVPGGSFPIGTTVVTYTGIDNAGNSSQCKFNVIVTDAIAPVISNCPENIRIVIANSSGKTPAQWVIPTANDNCTLASFTSTHQVGDLFSTGTTDVRYTAIDKSGNEATCFFTVTIVLQVLDLQIPAIVTPDANGIDDEWRIINLEKYETNSVVIVDRWGSVIYNASGYNNGSKVWEGQNTKGDPVPTGTYFYTLSVKTGDSFVEKRGFIELIR